MFKKLIIILLNTVLIFSLIACTDSEQNNNYTENDSENEELIHNEGKVNFPKKPIQIVVPYTAGGGTDSVARAIANSAEKYLGQSVVVVNKVGGSGAVGMSEGANSEPDGYTVTMITSELTTLPNLGLAPFTYKDFKPVLQLNADPAALTAKADAPWDTVQDFLDYAKAHPGKAKTGNSGMGAIWHLAAQKIERETKVKVNHVPFDGAAPAAVALLGGYIDVVTVSPAEVLSHVNNKELKVLGVLADERIDSLPYVPTFKEEGIDLSIGTWRGLAVPKDTPDEVVKILEEGFIKAAEDSAFKNVLNKLGLGYKVTNADDFGKTITEYNEFIRMLVHELGL